VQILVLDADPARRMSHLDQHPGWARVYWDPVAEVYLRKGGRYADVIVDHEYRLTRPIDDLSYLAAYRRDSATWTRAIAELRRAVVDNPENVQAWMSLAQEYGDAGPSARGQRLEALTHATTVLAGNPATGRLHAERAEILLRLGRAEEAMVAAHEALSLDGDLLLPWDVLAAVAERRGAWAEARDQLRMILAGLRPDDGEAQDIGRRLEAAERNLQAEGSR